MEKTFSVIHTRLRLISTVPLWILCYPSFAVPEFHAGLTSISCVYVQAASHVQPQDSQLSDYVDCLYKLGLDIGLWWVEVKAGIHLWCSLPNGQKWVEHHQPDEAHRCATASQKDVTLEPHHHSNNMEPLSALFLAASVIWSLYILNDLCFKLHKHE